MSTIALISNPVSYSLPMSPTITHFLFNTEPTKSAAKRTATSQKARSRMPKSTCNDPVATTFRNHFWFGSEESEHVKAIMRFYADFLGIDTKERRQKYGRVSRAPEEFVGCVDRRLTKICEFSGTEQPNGTICNGKLCDKSSFTTLDSVHVYQRDGSVLGTNMTYLRTRYLTTFWDCADGLPTHATKINCENDYDFYRNEAEEYVKHLNEMSTKLLFPTRCYLYCEPVYEAPSDYSFYSTTTKCGKYKHTQCLSPVIAKRSFQQSQTSMSYTITHRHGITVGSHHHHSGMITIEHELHKDRHIEDRQHDDDDDDGIDYCPEIGYSATINSCIAYSMSFLIQGKELTTSQEDLDNENFGSEPMIKPKEEPSKPIIVAASTSIRRNDHPDSPPQNPYQRSQSHRGDLVFDLEEDDAKSDEDDDLLNETSSSVQANRTDDFDDISLGFSQPLSTSAQSYSYELYSSRSDDSSASSNELPTSSTRLNRSQSAPITIRRSSAPKSTTRNRFSASPVRNEPVFSPLSNSPHSPIDYFYGSNSNSVDESDVQSYMDSISQPAGLNGMVFGMDFSDLDDIEEEDFGEERWSDED